MKTPDEEIKLTVRSRNSETVTIVIPSDTLESLQKIAASRDMSVEALIKFYVGQGLRLDLARHFSERVLERTAEVLSRHIKSAEELSNILNEIRIEAIP
jgi:hypothetical protein